MNPKLDPDSVNAVGGYGRNLAKFCVTETANTQQKLKRQVRRRVHTSKPYPERLLNVAEARREIVTALKFHRAAMKQANEQQQQQQQQQLTQPSLPNPYYLPAASPIPLSSALIDDALNFNLPNQTLGQKLNFHAFNNMHTNHPSIFYSSSSSLTLTEKFPSVALSYDAVKLADHEDGDFGYQLPFDQLLMEFLDWLNAIDNSCFLHQHFNHLCPGDHYFQEPALPCMEIEEIEGMDGDWLA